MVSSRQMDRRLSPPASREQMVLAVSVVYRVGRPRPRRAFGFGLAFRLSERVALDDVVIARGPYPIEPIRGKRDPDLRPDAGRLAADALLQIASLQNAIATTPARTPAEAAVRRRRIAALERAGIIPWVAF